ncbi:MAG: amino acid permease [Gammaproteobacteria bacterium]|nr:MAG: amino acid permease [Gammaproteobacteria bacterium]
MDKGKLSLWEAVALAVGTMIGAGIFSILGVGAQICGSNLPVAFLLAGFITLFVAYSYAHLGKVFISNAGPVEFILRAFGDRIFVGVLAFLYWFSFVVSISLFAKAFAYYLFALLHLPATPLKMAIAEAGIIAFFTALNFFGTKAVGRVEFFIVLLKVLILLLFISAGLWSINPQWLKPDFSPLGVQNTLFASAVLFLTYTGFGVITNASENLENPKKNLPRAIYISLFLVAFIYVSIAVVTIGNLPLDRLLSAKEYALAEASKPFLGEFGFTLLSIGALISTSSALNASLYGGANVAYVFAKKGKLPEIFERRIWFGEPEGLYITALLSFLFASLFNLEGIASLISFSFLVLYWFVLLSHRRLLVQVGGKGWIPLMGLFLITAVGVTLLYYQYQTDKSVFFTASALIPLITLFEWLYKGKTQRVFKPRFHKKPL